MLDRSLLLLKSICAGQEHQLSTSELMDLQLAAHEVYEEVAFDMADPEIKRAQTCSRSNVLEVVLDAGRIRDNLTRSRNLTPALETALSGAASYEELIDMIGPAFMYEEYEIGGY